MLKQQVSRIVYPQRSCPPHKPEPLATKSRSLESLGKVQLTYSLKVTVNAQTLMQRPQKTRKNPYLPDSLADSQILSGSSN